jgi:hypothetical protein
MKPISPEMIEQVRPLLAEEGYTDMFTLCEGTILVVEAGPGAKLNFPKLRRVASALKSLTGAARVQLGLDPDGIEFIVRDAIVQPGEAGSDDRCEECGAHVGDKHYPECPEMRP